MIKPATIKELEDRIKELKNRKIQIIITTEGGTIQAVGTNMPKHNIEVIIKDYDTQNADPGDGGLYKDIDGEDVFIGHDHIQGILYKITKEQENYYFEEKYKEVQPNEQRTNS